MPSPAPRASFVLPVRVYYEDTDAAGIVYYANYLRFFERARTEWLRALGFEQPRLADELGIAFVVRSISVEYLKPAQLDDALNVVSEIVSLGRVQIVFDQNIVRDGAQGSELLLTARMRLACIAPAGMRPAAMPEDMYETFKVLTGNRA
jgi:acyl-CoA thioester hydrolase